MHSRKHWICIIFGLIIGALSIIPLLNNFGVIKFSLPFTLGRIILAFLMGIAGLWLVTLVHHSHGGIKTPAILVGILCLILGIITILSYFGVIAFSTSTIPEMIFNIILAIGSILLLVAGFHP